MDEIRLGLLKNLNVSIYAKSTFSSFKMKITRERLENEQNTQQFINRKLNKNRMV